MRHTDLEPEGPKIIDDVHHLKMKSKLLELPQQIHAKKADVRRAREAVQAQRQACDLIEVEFIAAIAAEVDEKGKARFSNQQARDGELLVRKQASTLYQAAWTRYLSLKEHLETEESKLELLQDEYRSYQLIVGLVTAEVYRDQVPLTPKLELAPNPF